MFKALLPISLFILSLSMESHALQRFVCETSEVVFYGEFIYANNSLSADLNLKDLKQNTSLFDFVQSSKQNTVKNLNDSYSSVFIVEDGLLKVRLYREGQMIKTCQSSLN